MELLKRYFRDSIIIGIFMILNTICIVNKFNCFFVGIILVLIFFILNMISQIEIIKIQCYYLIASTFCLDFFWIFTRLEVPLSMRFYVDIMNIILFLKLILENKFSRIVRDPIFICTTIIIAFNISRIIGGNYSIYNVFLGIRSYFRWIIVYFTVSIVKIEKEKLKNTVIYIYMIQVALMIPQWLVYPDRDQITGTFGLYGTHYVLCFVCIIFFYSIFRKVNARFTIIKAISILSVLLVIIIGEIKIAIVILPIVIVFVYILISNEKIYKKVILITFIPLVSFYVASGLESVYSNFEGFFEMDNMVKYYNFKNPVYSYGRLDNLQIIYENQLDNRLYLYLGRGIGYGVPSDFNTYGLNYGQGRKITELEPSKYYLNNKGNGYEVVSTNVVFLENGIVGMIIFLVIFILLIWRGIKLYKTSRDSDVQSISLTYIGFLLVFIIECIYSDVLFNVQSAFILSFFSGYIKNIMGNEIARGE